MTVEVGRYYSNGASWVRLGVGAPPPPPPPTGVAPATAPGLFTATAGDSQVACSWQAVSGATGYRLRLDGTTVYEGALLSRTLTGLTNGTAYSLTVAAYNATGEGPSAGPLVRTPAGADVPPYDADLGTIGDRPALTVAPTATTTGPRVSRTQTLSGAQALAAVLAAPLEADGYRYLRRATITSTIVLNQPNHTNIVFEDCHITGTSTYSLETFWGTSNVPSGRWPEFRYCRIGAVDGTTYVGSNVTGSYVRLLRCKVEYGIDQCKLFGRNELYACWLGNGIKSGQSHSDTLQVQRGVDILVHWCNVTGGTSPDSPDRPSSRMDRALQTGGLLGDGIQNTRYLNNWFDGGFDYCVSIGTTGPPALDHWFRGNKFGRQASGSVTGSRAQSSSAPDGGVRFDSSNVFIDNGQPA